MILRFQSSTSLIPQPPSWLQAIGHVDLAENEAAIQTEDLAGQGGPIVGRQIGNSGSRVVRSKASIERLPVHNGVEVALRIRGAGPRCVGQAWCHGGHRDSTLAE